MKLYSETFTWQCRTTFDAAQLRTIDQIDYNNFEIYIKMLLS